jgi:endonuclease IV
LLRVKTQNTKTHALVYGKIDVTSLRNWKIHSGLSENPDITESPKNLSQNKKIAKIEKNLF